METALTAVTGTLLGAVVAYRRSYDRRAAARQALVRAQLVCEGLIEAAAPGVR
ncbi:hypothetical protein [Streptomyces sp. CB03238]|uniref:hypothetical protein n=1 Tax=Streptomyces sp. CB03238 TaxID=1907777 RepID=UPI0015C4AB4A|nr:hypothetical protein [Streptomyces sp. CB03238]